MKGAQALREAIAGGADARAVRVLNAPCMGLCDRAPAVAVGRNHFGAATPQAALQAAADGPLMTEPGAYTVPPTGARAVGAQDLDDVGVLIAHVNEATLRPHRPRGLRRPGRGLETADT